MSDTKTVPFVPDNLRKQRYREARERYMNGEIDECELEQAIEDALIGRIGFDMLLTSVDFRRSPHLGAGPSRYCGVPVGL